jgi:hypothetical protein
MSQRSEYMAIVAAMSRIDQPPAIIAELAFDLWKAAQKIGIGLEDDFSTAVEIIGAFKEWGHR